MKDHYSTFLKKYYFHRIASLSLIWALCISIYPQQTSAAANFNGDITRSNPNSVIIDTNNKSNVIDYNALNKFIKSRDDHEARFFETDGNQVIFSRKPIVLTNHTYTPSHLSDLGIQIVFGRQITKEIVVKTPPYHLVKISFYKLPSIPSALITHNSLNIKPETEKYFTELWMPLTTVLLCSIFLLLRIRRRKLTSISIHNIGKPYTDKDVSKIIDQYTISPQKKSQREDKKLEKEDA